MRGDAADGRDHPDLVARADAAVGAAIAHELNVSLGKVGRRQRFEAVVLDPFKQCLQIVRVNILAKSNRRRRHPDRPAEFVYRIAGRKIADRKLVALFDCLGNENLFPHALDPLTGAKRPQRDSNIVIRVEANGVGRLPRCLLVNRCIHREPYQT